jgi:two-component system heavy metal sensor histidine kinase CusS
MSSIPAPRELSSVLSADEQALPMIARIGLRVRRSMALQIALAITSISLVLVVASCWMVGRLLAQELDEISEPMLFANLAFLQQDLVAADFVFDPQSRQLANRRASQLGQLEVALLDSERRPIVTSDHFAVPLSALPAKAWDVESVPQTQSYDELREMRADGQAMTEVWTSPRGKSYRVLFASIPVPAAAATRYGTRIYAALAIDLSPTRAFVSRAWRILFVTLGVGALAAALFAWWITRRILVVTQRLGTTANRISAQALHERLLPDQSPAELEPVALAFNRMLDRLEDAFGRLSEFSSDLAHDLRAPIHNLLAAAQVTLSRSRTADEYRAVLESSVEDYERIARLIDNMLFLARADHAQTAIRRSWIGLDARLGRIAEFYELLAEEHGVTLALEVQGTEGDPPRIWADDTLLGRAVGNLLTNAIRHATPGSEVTLSAVQHSLDACTISVANFGAPIAPHHQAEIFQRRYRIEDPMAHAEPGSGLGLAIVKTIMDLHGGTARVDSADGQPTVFSLSFPAPARAAN